MDLLGPNLKGAIEEDEWSEVANTRRGHWGSLRGTLVEKDEGVYPNQRLKVTDIEEKEKGGLEGQGNRL